MASKATETEGRDEPSWRQFPAMTNYFPPAIVPLLKHLELDSKQVVREFGEQGGGRQLLRGPPFHSIVCSTVREDLAGVQYLHAEGRKQQPDGRSGLELHRARAARRDGEMLECPSQEGFFRGDLSAHPGKPVKVSQETNYLGMPAPGADALPQRCRSPSIRLLLVVHRVS